MVPPTSVPISGEDYGLDVGATQDGIRSQGPEQSQGAQGWIHRSSQPRRATTQDIAILETRTAESGLARGYTRIPNRLLMLVVAGQLTKTEIQVVLYVARMTISFKRQYVSLSKSVLSQRTGIQGSAVLQVLSSLERKGLIRRITGNASTPTQIALTEAAMGETGGGASLDSNSTQDRNLTQGDSEPASLGILPSHRKGYSEKIEKLSLKEIPLCLKEHFANLKPARKRESEQAAYAELLGDYTPEVSPSARNAR